jgi:hypothetical protein
LIEPPGQPMRLESIDEGAGTLLIEWKRPVRGSGGPVRTYIIERRDLTIDETGDGGIGRGNKWKQAAISLETTATLKDQPRGIQLEYRVKAISPKWRARPALLFVRATPAWITCCYGAPAEYQSSELSCSASFSFRLI